ncbi:MAG: LysR family transcriptional regulator [Gammaproteobacteria bacterium]|nr:LysR family transcriptional regulator [Gammaproteobacteria bacterium]MDH5801481.1 LysR family transcriptional regulator [Gammaproteobacteria bacterium]
MDTDQLKTFLEISRTRHFGRAAQNLYLSQSAVSSRIKALEDQLGTPLFVRNRNDIQLTPAGNRLLNHAENILAAWGRAKHDVAIEEEMSTSLAIAATPSLWDIAMQDWLQNLHQRQPHIAVHGEVMETESILRRLMEGSLDLGFTFEPSQRPQIETRQFTSISLIMVSTSNQQSLDQALNHNYVLVDWGLSFAINHARHFPSLRTPGIRLPLGHIAKAYLLNCGGTAYLAESTVVDEINNGQLFKVEDAPIIERTAYAMFSTLTQPEDGLQAVLASLG